MESKDNQELLVLLAKKVKALRTEKGLSQLDAYNDTGIHFGRIELGQRDVSISTLKKLSSFFDVSLSELVEGL